MLAQLNGAQLKEMHDGLRKLGFIPLEFGNLRELKVTQQRKMKENPGLVDELPDGRVSWTQGSIVVWVKANPGDYRAEVEALKKVPHIYVTER